MSYIIKYNYIIGLLFVSIQVFADQHKAVGVHGMVLLEINQQFYASHLPLAHSMHAQQVVFRFSVNAADKKNIQDLVADNPLVTIMPERFDLHRLMVQDLLSFKASVFAGHFERGGRKALGDVNIDIDEIMLNEPMQSLDSLVSNGTYYQLTLKNGEALFVHKIGAAPSFDHIFLGKVISNRGIDSRSMTSLSLADEQILNQQNINQTLSRKPKQVDFTLSQPVNRENAQAWLNTHGINFVQSLYLETQDFAR